MLVLQIKNSIMENASHLINIISNLHECVGLLFVIQHRLEGHVEDPLRDVKLDFVLVPHLPPQLLLLLVRLDCRRLG